MFEEKHPGAENGIAVYGIEEEKSMKMKIADWPVLVVSGEFNVQSDDGCRLRELMSQLEDVEECSVISSGSYEDALEIFTSRADLGRKCCWRAFGREIVKFR